MANITLKCPSCGQEIQAGSKVGLENMTATCPKCQYKEVIAKFIPKYSLSVDGKYYQLRLGKQWIGRDSEVGKADVKIPDNTRYMSKMHAQIELTCSLQGITCTFEENGMNPTSLQGIELVKGDIVYLNINDCLQLGARKMYLSNEFGE